MTKAQKEAASKLNPRQRKFCEEYVKTGNVAKSMVAAGYEKHSASANGSRLLKNAKIIDYIATITEKTADNGIADGQEAMKFISDTMRGKVKDQFDLDVPADVRLRAAVEILKRTVDLKQPVEARVTIVNDIPRGSNGE